LAAWEPDDSPVAALSTTLANVALARDSSLATITTSRAGADAVELASRARRGLRGAVVVVFEDRPSPFAPAPAGTTVVRCTVQSWPNGFASAWEANVGPRRLPANQSAGWA
jgi:hypothetical protein